MLGQQGGGAGEGRQIPAGLSSRKDEVDGAAGRSCNQGPSETPAPTSPSTRQMHIPPWLWFSWTDGADSILEGNKKMSDGRGPAKAMGGKSRPASAWTSELKNTDTAEQKGCMTRAKRTCTRERPRRQRKVVVAIQVTTADVNRSGDPGLSQMRQLCLTGPKPGRASDHRARMCWSTGSSGPYAAAVQGNATRSVASSGPATTPWVKADRCGSAVEYRRLWKNCERGPA